jgi:plasmid stabilization system protein ParE
MKYRISRKANTDIEGICNRIALDNPEAADQMDERIHRAIELLAEVPGMGHRRTDVRDERYLFWAVGNCIIAYRVETDLIVVRVVHGTRDFRRLF